MLITRIFSDIFEPRVGKLNIMQTKNQSQVVTVVFHSCFKSLEAVNVHKEHNISKHPNIASEHVKFISYNTPCQLVDMLEKKVNKVDERVTEHVSSSKGLLKQVNTASGKVENHDSKIKNLESRVSKLEKK